ncbi:MAG: hypothetical protein ACOC34_04820, partial [Thermotogota bacterium]
MAQENIIADVKKIHDEYLKLISEQTPFLSTRIKARIKLRFKKDLNEKVSDKKKLEKMVQKNINSTQLVSWTRINSLTWDNQKEIMEIFQSWLFSIS